MPSMPPYIKNSSSKNSNIFMSIIVLILGVLIVGGLGFYFKTTTDSQFDVETEKIKNIKIDDGSSTRVPSHALSIRLDDGMGITTLRNSIAIVDISSQALQLGIPYNNLTKKVEYIKTSDQFLSVKDKFNNPDITASYIQLDDGMAITTIKDGTDQIIGPSVAIVDENTGTVVLLDPNGKAYHKPGADYYSLALKKKRNASNISRMSCIRLENGMGITTVGNRVVFVDDPASSTLLIVRS